MNDTDLDVGGWARGVEGLGPGRRVILWVRGCDLGCAGCMTPELWAPHPREKWRPVAEIAAEIAPALRETDCAGLTISGGEPMQQAEALSALVHILRSEFAPELEVMVYSGYALEELENRPEIAPFLDQIDLLMDGRFQNAAANERQWRGSDNQRLHLLSERAQRYMGADAAAMPQNRVLGVQSLDVGSYRIVGIPKRGDLKKYRELMEKRGLSVRPDV